MILLIQEAGTIIATYIDKLFFHKLFRFRLRWVWLSCVGMGREPQHARGLCPKASRLNRVVFNDRSMCGDTRFSILVPFFAKEAKNEA